MSAGFARRVLAWANCHGRRGLPWQGSRDPYRVWLAEIMLQQTQVAAVVPYYRRFVARFPDLAALARADPSEVLSLWAGLGYYARARHLLRCAQLLWAEHGGGFPRSAAALARLPGIGRSTAAAIAAFCFDERAAILDGNVKRVMVRHDAIAGDPRAPAVERLLWRRAQRRLPAAAAMPAYTQALMDLGATVCTRRAPRCDECPLRATCIARRTGRTAELPAARPRPTLRVERRYALVPLWRGRVGLQLRPPAGVWGGLLAPPLYASAGALRRAVRVLGAAESAQTLPPREHVFTHFTLHVTPVLVRLSAPPREGAALHWLRRSQFAAAPLPAPIRRLLAELAPRVRARRAASGTG